MRPWQVELLKLQRHLEIEKHADDRALRGPRRRRQGRRDPARHPLHEREALPGGRPGPPTEEQRSPAGTSSAMWRSSRPAARSCCSTAAGTTARWSSRSSASAPQGVPELPARASPASRRTWYARARYNAIPVPGNWKNARAASKMPKPARIIAKSRAHGCSDQRLSEARIQITPLMTASQPHSPTCSTAGRSPKVRTSQSRWPAGRRRRIRTRPAARRSQGPRSELVGSARVVSLQLPNEGLMPLHDGRLTDRPCVRTGRLGPAAREANTSNPGAERRLRVESTRSPHAAQASQLLAAPGLELPLAATSCRAAPKSAAATSAAVVIGIDGSIGADLRPVDGHLPGVHDQRCADLLGSHPVDGP